MSIFGKKIQIVKDAIIKKLSFLFQTMQSHCIKVFAKKVPESEMRESFSLIHEKFTSSTEGVLDDMSSYAKKNILTVPPHIVLPGMVKKSFFR